LDTELRRYRNAALADNTKASYRTHRDTFIKFCAFFSYKPVPASSLTLSRFAAFLARTLRPQSVKVYMAGVRILHLELGYPSPIDNNWLLSTTLKGIMHLNATAPRQKLPITPAILLKLKHALTRYDSFECCFWAACLVAFYSFFRKSTLLTKSPGKHDCRRDLCKRDVTITPTGAVIKVKHTKTLQDYSRHLLVPLPRITGSPLCPVAALETLFDHVKYEPGDALFSFNKDGKTVPLTHRWFMLALKSMLTKLGYDSAIYSGHSFRRGGASYAFACGLPPNMIKTQGDWRSDAYERSLTYPLP